LVAFVKPSDGLQRVLDPTSDLEPGGRVAAPRRARDPDTLHVIVRRTAQIQDVAPVTSDRDDFGISMPRRGGRSALCDAINQMLGRDPEQHRPPRLSWDQLTDTLAHVGFSVIEQELVDAPLTVELSPEVNGQLADAGARADLLERVRPIAPAPPRYRLRWKLAGAASRPRSPHAKSSDEAVMYLARFPSNGAEMSASGRKLGWTGVSGRWVLRWRGR
jgi:hypothetical protein